MRHFAKDQASKHVIIVDLCFPSHLFFVLFFIKRVEMKEAILTEANLYIVMEYVPGLSLFDHILQVRTYQGMVPAL